MDPPKSKPKPNATAKPKDPEDLVEVERALSVLQGRHPETERLRREDRAQIARRQAEHSAEAASVARRARLRGLLLSVGAIVGAGAITYIVGIVKTESARRGKIDEAAAPYRPLGFTVVDTTSRGEPSKLDADVPVGCVLATATKPDAIVRLAHPKGVLEGPSPVFTCICEGGRVTASVAGPGLRAGEGMAILRADTSVFGGSRAFPFLPFKPGAIAASDAACAESELDAWLEAKTWARTTGKPGEPRAKNPPEPGAAERWFAERAERALLEKVGFTLLATVPRSTPLSVVEVPADACVLLVPDDATTRTGLRVKGGSFAIGPTAGSALFCTSAELLAVAPREGEGAVTILSAPAAKVGGLIGAREIVGRSGLALAAAAVPSKDHAWSARHLLAASAIPETLITTASAPDLGDDPEARILVVSVEKPGAFVPDTPADVYSYCDPRLDTSTSTICVFSGKQKWRAEGESPGGLARARLPFWLLAAQGVSEPAALKLETELVGLARRLKRDGFEPTTIEAVTEIDRGAEVLGRAGEDAMVVVSLSPGEPWVAPYTDGAAWSLTGEPRVVPIKPLERVVVTPVLKRTPPPKATRRTIVFRRQKR